MAVPTVLRDTSSSPESSSMVIVDIRGCGGKGMGAATGARMAGAASAGTGVASLGLGAGVMG